MRFEVVEPRLGFLGWSLSEVVRKFHPSSFSIRSPSQSPSLLSSSLSISHSLNIYIYTSHIHTLFISIEFIFTRYNTYTD